MSPADHNTEEIRFSFHNPNRDMNAFLLVGRIDAFNDNGSFLIRRRFRLAAPPFTEFSLGTTGLSLKPPSDVP